MKISQDNPPLIYLYRHKSRVLQKPENPTEASSTIKTVQNSLPSLPLTTNTSLSQDKDVKYHQRLNNNLIIKRNETLKAYRIRLRALLDSQFSVNIPKIKPKPASNASNLFQLRPTESIPRKRLDSLKPIESYFQPRAFKLYKPSQDPYFFANIQQKGNFSSFISILNIFTDTIAGFTYCGKPPKKPSDIKIFVNETKILNQLNEKPHPVAELKKIRRIREEFPWTRRVFYSPQRVECFNKIFVLELESVLVNGTFLEYAAEALRIVSGMVQIIFVIDKGTDVQKVLDQVERIQVVCSAVYEIENSKGKMGFLDYSQIFLDFQCFEPCDDCLVFTKHYLEDLDSDKKEFVGRQVGCSIKLNVMKIPLFSHEFPRQPILVTLFSEKIDCDCSNLVRVSEIVMGYIKMNFSMRNLLSFSKILKNCEVVESDLPHRSIVPHHVLIDYYKFIKSSVSAKELKIFMINSFIF